MTKIADDCEHALRKAHAREAELERQIRDMGQRQYEHPWTVNEAERLKQRVTELEQQLAAAREKLEEIVCTVEPDRGVVLLSNYGPTHIEVYDNRKYVVYDHENFSSLGDALIALHDLVIAAQSTPPAAAEQKQIASGYESAADDLDAARKETDTHGS